MRLVSLTVLFAFVVASTASVSAALAEGGPATRAHTKSAFPHAQRNVVVTMEHGVRVWRPVAAHVQDDAGYYPQATSASDPGYDELGTVYGWGAGPGLGFNHGPHKHGQLQSRRAYGVTVHTPAYPRYALAQTAPNRPTHGAPVQVRINVGPMVGYSGPGRTALGRGTFGHGGFGHGGGHVGAAHGGGGHR